MAHRAPVVVVPYSNAWPQRFETERALLAQIFAGSSCFIEHVGSTSVPDLAAKPIIDIMLGISDLAEVNTRLAAMQEDGYEYLPQHETLMPERRFFAKPVTRPRHFHVHVVAHGGAFWTRHLTFRNALRADHELARSYAALKFRLAAEFGDDRDAYTDAKSPFITDVVHKAMQAGDVANPSFQRTATPPLN